MNSDTSPRWADRLGTGTRTTLIVATFIANVFALGMICGYSYYWIEAGRLPTKPLAWLIFAAMLALVAALGWSLLGLLRSISAERMSRFDQRYLKMWAILAGLGVPLIIGVAMLTLNENMSFNAMVLSNDPIMPLTAVLGAILLSAILVVSMVIYFRAIDDHEARAYLWASNIAFHFLALAFPLYWLLARGGLVPTLTIGIALLIVLLSCIVQAIVWALFKFR